jgi:hypothetical protein
MPEVVAFSSLAPKAEPEQTCGVMSQQDPFRSLLDVLRTLVPYGKVAGAAREMGISTSHLHGILKGTSDASAENRRKIAEYVARRGGNVTAPSDLVLDPEPQPAHTAPHQPVVGPSESPGLEVQVPTPYHAALCDLISTLPVPVVLQLIPQVAQLAEQEYQKIQAAPAPTPEAPKE